MNKGSLIHLFINYISSPRAFRPHHAYRRTKYGYLQTTQYVNPDLYHEEVEEIDAASLWSPNFETGTEVYSYVVLGDQNAGKSTFLHALTNDSSRNFLQICNFYPMLSSTFINSRLISSRGSPIDEYPFLDTDLARASTLLSADAFQFFCKEQGLPWSREDWKLAPSTKFVGMTFVEVGGDHLDRMMVFYAIEFLKAKRQKEAKAEQWQVQDYQKLWLSKFISLTTTESKDSLNVTDEEMTKLYETLQEDAPERLEASVLNSVLRKSVSLVQDSAHTLYFVKLESLLEWEDSFLLQWLQSQTEASKESGETGSEESGIAQGKEKRPTRPPRGYQKVAQIHESTEQLDSNISTSNSSLIPNAKINLDSLTQLVRRVCFITQVAEDSKTRADTYSNLSHSSISLLLTRSPIFTHQNPSPVGKSGGNEELPMSELISSVWQEAGEEQSRGPITVTPDADIPAAPLDPIIYLELEDLLEKMTRIISTVCASTPGAISSSDFASAEVVFTAFVRSILDPVHIISKAYRSEKWLSSSASCIVRHTVVRHGRKAIPLSIGLSLILQAALISMHADALRVIDARYAEHVLGSTNDVKNMKCIPATPKDAHDFAHSVQLLKCDGSETSSKRVFGKAFEQNVPALLKTIRELLVTQQLNMRASYSSDSISLPLDHVATVILRCFLETVGNFTEEGLHPYLQMDRFCEFLADHHGGHSHSHSHDSEDIDHEIHSHTKGDHDICEEKHEERERGVSDQSEEIDPWLEESEEDLVNVSQHFSLPEAVALRLFPDSAAALVRGNSAILHCVDCFSNIRIAFESPSLGLFVWHPLISSRKKSSISTIRDALCESYAHEWSLRDRFTPCPAAIAEAGRYESAKQDSSYTPKARLLWEKAIESKQSESSSMFVRGSPSAIAIRFPFTPVVLQERYIVADQSVNAEVWETSELNGLPALSLSTSHNLSGNNASKDLLGRIESHWASLCSSVGENAKILARQIMLFIWTLEEYNLINQPHISGEKSVNACQISVKKCDHLVGLQNLGAIPVEKPLIHEGDYESGKREHLTKAGIHLLIKLSD